MMKFICLFFPAVIFLDMVEKNKKLGNNNYIRIKEYIKCNLCINTIMLFIVWVYVGFKQKLIDDNLFTVSFCFKYLVISICIAYIIPTVFYWLKNNVSLNIEVEDIKNEKRKNKKVNNRH